MCDACVSQGRRVLATLPAEDRALLERWTEHRMRQVEEDAEADAVRVKYDAVEQVETVRAAVRAAVKEFDELVQKATITKDTTLGDVAGLVETHKKLSGAVRELYTALDMEPPE